MLRDFCGTDEQNFEMSKENSLKSIGGLMGKDFLIK